MSHTPFIEYIKEDQYEDRVLKSDLPVVLDFFSTECPPCEALAVKFEPLSEIYGQEIRFIKIFRQENRSLAEHLNVRSSPTLLFYRDGKEAAERLNGAIRKAALIDRLHSLLSPEKVEGAIIRRMCLRTRTVCLIAADCVLAAFFHVVGW